jgi:hypothetical protein
MKPESDESSFAFLERLRRILPRGVIIGDMNLKSAAFLALIGTILTTVLLVYNLIFSVLNVMRGLIPLDNLFSTLIYAFASLTVAVFFFVFHKQS